MKILSWNVNGIRSVIKNGFTDFLKNEKPDVLCLQEIKIDAEIIKKENIKFAGYEIFWSPAERSGYSGTAILGRKNFLEDKTDSLEFQISDSIYEIEGRIQSLEFDKFFLINVYFPHSGRDLHNLRKKIEFNKQFLKYISRLIKEKPIVICGDFNVAPQEIDLARPKDNVKNAGFTPIEREWVEIFLQNGLIDTFRYLNPEKRQYTWWTYRFDARKRNIGWRIDNILVSDKLISRVKKAFILDKVMGSDHCPIGIQLEL